MVGNEWINGYLEAIMDSGASAIEDQSKSAAAVSLRERGDFNPTKYFVEEVMTGVDETDLHRTWIKVVATRNTSERSSRLENMCWRIWHLTRKKKQLEWDDVRRIAQRRWEREQGRRDATEEMSEGEKGDVLGEAMVVKRSGMGMEGSGEGTVVTTEPIYERLRHLASGNAVVVFTVTGCCMSHVVKQLLFGLGVGPTIIELDRHDAGKEILDVLCCLAAGTGEDHGGWQQPVPAVFVSGKYLGGVETVMASHINGTLVPLLKDSGALWL